MLSAAHANESTNKALIKEPPLTFLEALYLSHLILVAMGLLFHNTLLEYTL